MVDRKRAQEVYTAPLDVVMKRCEIPESLIPYTEKAGSLDEMQVILSMEYVLSDLPSEEYDKINNDFKTYFEACCEEFSIGAMLPQPGQGKEGVDDDSLADLASDPWMDDKEESKESYKVSKPLIDYVNNPGYTYSEDVALAVEHMMCDCDSPVCQCPVCDELKRPMVDRALLKSKLRVANRLGADDYIKRDIKGELLDREREIRGLKRGGYCRPEDELHCKEMEKEMDSLLKSQEEKRYFPTEPLDEFPDTVPGIDKECGSSCGGGSGSCDECGDSCGGGSGCGCETCDNCGGSGCSNCSEEKEVEEAVNVTIQQQNNPGKDHKSIGQAVKDVGKYVKRFGEDFSADVKADLNLIGRKLKTIEKHYKKTDPKFVPARALNGTRTTLNNNDVKDSDLNMSRSEKKNVYAASKRENALSGNRSVIMMNGQVPWFKYILSDSGGKEKKRHIEYEFTANSVKYAEYYRAVIASRYNVMSATLQDWVSKKYDEIKNGTAGQPEQPQQAQEDDNSQEGDES